MNISMHHSIISRPFGSGNRPIQPVRMREGVQRDVLKFGELLGNDSGIIIGGKPEFKVHDGSKSDR